MPFLQTIERDDVRISFWRTTERQSEMLSFLPADKGYAQRIAGFKSERRRLEWLAVRALLHHVLGDEAAIDYLPSGRPLLVDTDQELSITHTGDLVALAIAPAGLEIGIDLERKYERAYQMMARYLSDEEQAKLVRHPDDAALLWCAKEAIYKLCDTKGLRFLDDMRLYKAGGQLFAELPTLAVEIALDTEHIHGVAFAVARYLR